MKEKKERTPMILSVVGLILGTVSFFIFGFYGATPLLSLILSNTGRKLCKKAKRATWVATLGMVISALNLLVCLVLLLEGGFANA